MEQLIEILKELHPDVDYENCTTLITDKILDSFDMITIIAEVHNRFDVVITADEFERLIRQGFDAKDLC